VEKSKRKNPDNIRRYWYVFLPLMIVLAVMTYFPLRIDLTESLYDSIFYGAISLACLSMAIHVYRRFFIRSRRLIAVILLCSLLSGWQVFDLTVLRKQSWGPLPGYIIYYAPRFPDATILCHNYTETYIGNRYIAVIDKINREASWYACGG